jgi:hypothetical protein
MGSPEIRCDKCGVTSVVCGAINGRSDHHTHTHTQTLTENYHKIPVATGVRSTRKDATVPWSTWLLDKGAAAAASQEEEEEGEGEEEERKVWCGVVQCESV